VKAIHWWVVGILLVIQASAGAWGQEPKRGRDPIAFRLYGGYLIVVEGEIGDKKGLKFGLDTGITHTTIDRRIANALTASEKGLQGGKVVNFDRVIKAEWTELTDLTFGPIEVRNLSVMIGDLRYLETTGTHVDAMIGLDVLSRRNFSIDYEHRKLSWGPSEPAPNELAMNQEGQCWTIDMTVGGRTLRAVVDTGAPGVVFYEDRLVNRGIDFHVGNEIVGVSAGGHIRSRMAVLPRLQVGRRDLDRTVVLTRSPGVDSLPGIAGFWGPSSLRAKTVQLDFERKTLSWQ
jgi:predicted aspartyl protease